jgi:hypothetical protein
MKLVFVAAKVFVRAPIVIGFFTRVGKMFFMINRVKAVYFSLFGGFNAFDCRRSSFHLCQPYIFFRSCEIWKPGKS